MTYREALEKIATVNAMDYEYQTWARESLAKQGADMKITVQLKDVYGRQTAYPVCDKAKLFARLAGTATLTHDARQIIMALGYNIEVEPRHLS